MKFEFIDHYQLSANVLDDIISLKASVWDYSSNAHREWIKNNLEDQDIHLVLYDDADKLVGYLNIVELLVNHEESFGIGNVCISPSLQGQKLGLLLMSLAKYYIRVKNKKGYLLCKDRVSAFYKKCGWRRYTGQIKREDGEELNCNLFFLPSTKFEALSEMDCNSGDLTLSRTF